MHDGAEPPTPRPPGAFEPGSLMYGIKPGRGSADSPNPTIFYESVAYADAPRDSDSFIGELPRPRAIQHDSEASDITKEKVDTEDVDDGASRDPVAEEYPSRRVLAAVLGTSLGLAGLLLALTVALIAYVFANRAYFNSEMIFVKVPNNRILLVSSVISKLPPILPQVMMGVAAVGFGSDWLGTSMGVMHKGQGLRNDLTPEQYALLLRICSQAGPLSLVDAHAYYLRRFTKRARLPSMPPILIRGIIYITILTLLVQTSSILDTILHDKVYAAAFAQLHPADLTPQKSFGRQLNQTLCNDSLSMGVRSPQCTSVVITVSGVRMTEPYEGLLTAVNTSTVHEVIVVDGVALLMDRNRGQNTFMANTIGYTTTCKPISQQCGLFALLGTSSPFACPDYPLFLGNMADMESAAVLQVFNHSGTNQVQGSVNGVTGQPFELGVRYSVEAYGGPSDSQVVDSVHKLPTLLLWCEANVLSVTYRHEPYRKKPVTISSFELASDEDTFVVSGPYIHSFGNEFYTPVVASSFVHNDSNAMADAFSQTLSYVAVSMVAGMYEPSLNLVDYPVSVTYNGSEIHVPTFVLYLVSLLAVAVMCAWIGLATNRTEYALGIRHHHSGKLASSLELAALRLTDPGTLVHQLFSSEPAVPADERGTRMFAEVPAEERLHIGMIEGKFGVIPASRPIHAEGMVLA